MDAKKVSEIQGLIRKHQMTVQRQGATPVPRVIVPPGAGRLSDDLSKVQTTDVIGKTEHESDLRK